MSYFWEDFLKDDQFQTESIHISKDLVSGFADLTGDDNPFHVSYEDVSETPYEKPIAHGMLIMSLFVGLNRKLGILKNTSLGVVEVNWKFKKPVYINENLHFLIDIADKKETSREDRGILIRGVRGVVESREVVCNGTFVNIVKRKIP